MPDVSILQETSISANASHDDRVTNQYRVTYDSVPDNAYIALLRAQQAAGTPVPLRRSVYPTPQVTFLYADSIEGDRVSDSARNIWDWRVQYVKPPPSQLDTFEFADPLDRPPRFDIRYLERERVLDTGRNVQTLPHGDGNGKERPANTKGAITNSVGTEPDIALVDTERLELLVMSRNYPSLAAIVEQNRLYKRTTNSDSVQGYSARELRYLLTESLGEQEENGVRFWPGVTSILADETTDLVLNNVGYKYYDLGKEKILAARIEDPDTGQMVRPQDPVNLKLDGSLGGLVTTQIRYRHLDERSYEELLS